MTKLSNEKAVYFHKFLIYFRMFGMRRKQIQIATIETNISLQNPLKNGKIHDVTYGDITSPPWSRHRIGRQGQHQLSCG